MVRLSAVNRRLRAIWLQDSHHIVTHALQLKALGHQGAIDLNLLEARCSMPTTGFNTEAGPPLRLYLSQQMRNFGLASALCSRVPEFHERCRRRGKSLAHPLPPLFYLVRQLVVAYHYPQLRRPSCSILELLSDGPLRTCGRTVCSLVSDAPFSLHNALGVFHPVCDISWSRWSEIRRAAIGRGVWICR